MSIGLIKQSASSVPTPPPTEENLFFDAADDKLKKKISTGAVVDIEGLVSGVSSFNARTGVVAPVAGDYSANQISLTPSGGIVSTNVEAALYELDGEKVPTSHVGSGGAQHADATILASGFLSASDKTKIDNLATVAITGSYYDLSGTPSALPPNGAAGGDLSGTYPNPNLSTAKETYLLSRANHTGSQLAATISDFSTAADARITIQKGAANGIAPLNGSLKIDSTYLPAYVDDVLEFANLASFPITGSTGIIYIAIDTNKTYRWSGSTYVEISGPPASTDAVPEGITNLYFTEPRVLAADLLALPTNDWNIVSAVDSILQAIGKLALQSAMSPNTISSDATVPSGFTWIRQSRTIFSGTTKIKIQSGAKIKFI